MSDAAIDAIAACICPSVQRHNSNKPCRQHLVTARLVLSGLKEQGWTLQPPSEAVEGEESPWWRPGIPMPLTSRLRPTGGRE